MKVTNKRTWGEIEFCELHIGDVFEWVGDYYVVIPDVIDEETETYYNAFDLTNNALDSFGEDAVVTKVNAEIVIT